MKKMTSNPFDSTVLVIPIRQIIERLERKLRAAGIHDPAVYDLLAKTPKTLLITRDRKE